jgi:hypothetical protein
MSRLAVAVLTIALAATASADGWRSLRIDASSEGEFQQSLALFKKELSPERHAVFTQALADIWLRGTLDAEAEEREYTAAEFLRQLDGLGYEQVVNFTDPSGKTARTRYREAHEGSSSRRAASDGADEVVNQVGTRVRSPTDWHVRSSTVADTVPP